MLVIRLWCFLTLGLMQYLNKLFKCSIKSSLRISKNSLCCYFPFDMILPKRWKGCLLLLLKSWIFPSQSRSTKSMLAKMGSISDHPQWTWTSEFWNNTFKLAYFNFIFSNGHKGSLSKIGFMWSQNKRVYSKQSKFWIFNLSVQAPDDSKGGSYSVYITSYREQRSDCSH